MGVLFKTAWFGGFQKKEVIEYIEKLKIDCAREAQLLQEELVGWQREQELQTQSQQDLAQRLGQAQAELAQLQEHQQTLQHRADAALSEAQQARTQLESMRSQYSELKEYIADIELSAYKRAREVREEANRHAQEIAETIQCAGAAMSPVAEEAREKVELAEEAFGGFKTRISAITQEIDQLVQTMNQMEARSNPVKRDPPRDSQPPAASPGLRSIQEILERVKSIGEKM